MFYLIFAANNLSHSNFCTKFVIGVLTVREHNKRYKIKQMHTKQKRYKTSNVWDEVLMQSFYQKFVMVLSSSSQEYIYETKFNI